MHVIERGSVLEPVGTVREQHIDGGVRMSDRVPEHAVDPRNISMKPAGSPAYGLGHANTRQGDTSQGLTVDLVERALRLQYEDFPADVHRIA